MYYHDKFTHTIPMALYLRQSAKEPIWATGRVGAGKNAAEHL